MRRITAPPSAERLDRGYSPIGKLQQISCIDNIYVMILAVTSQEFKRWLTSQGCTFESGKGSHLIVRLGDRKSVLPMHGKQKELGTGLVKKIKKNLGLK